MILKRKIEINMKKKPKQFFGNYPGLIRSTVPVFSTEKYFCFPVSVEGKLMKNFNTLAAKTKATNPSNGRK